MSETDIDSLAAEYVLGTLDAGERAQVQAQLTVDQALAAKVRIWERRLSELHLMVEPIEPEIEIWEVIKRKVPRPASATPPVAAPVIASAVVAAAAETRSPEPPPTLRPVLPVIPEPSATADPWPALNLDPPARAKERRSLESLEEAVLRAADDLQRRATEEPVREPEPEPEPEPVVERVETIPAASSGPAEADGKTSEVTGSAPEESAKSAEEGPKTEEIPAAAKAAYEEPSPAGVVDDKSELKPEPKPEPKSEPKPADPLAAFPSSFTASGPASVVPTPSKTAIAPPPPPLPPPTPSVAVLRPENRLLPPAPKSRWLARTVATLSTLIVLAAAGLVAAWRFAPERVPQQLRPLELLRAAGIAVPTVVVGPPPRKPAPPESQYDE